MRKALNIKWSDPSAWTTIAVSRKTRYILNQLKAKYDLETYDQVIRLLLSYYAKTTVNRGVNHERERLLEEKP